MNFASKEIHDPSNGNTVTISMEKWSSDMGLFFISSNPDIDWFRIEFVCALWRSPMTHTALSGIVHKIVEQWNGDVVVVFVERISDEIGMILRLTADNGWIVLTWINTETRTEISIRIQQESELGGFRALMKAMENDNKEHPIHL